MSLRRTSLATSAVLGLAALALTACGPDSTTSAGPTPVPASPSGSTAPIASAPATTGPVATPPGSAAPTPAPTGSAAASHGPTPAPTAATPAPTARPSTSAKPSPTAKPSPSAKPSSSAAPSTSPVAGPTPTDDCTARAEANIGTVIQLTGVAPDGTLTAQKAQFFCGPDVPDDGYWQGAGAASQYTFAAGATFHLLAPLQPGAVSEQTFLKVAGACLTTPGANPSPYRCYGNKYAVTLGPGNTITSIDELYHP
ncbi:hypothetical protein [Kitasatospora sp. LaBMicrA B282]|uniref:hypothetical protein n=1 Tax=Kitasatospora sp. LaBMicrA B282 TaxID=3420949 RepID=UPI003D11FDC6